VPDLGRFTVKNLVRLGADRLRAAALWRYHYGVRGRDLDDLLGWPFLHRLEMFALRPPLPDGWAERLAACGNLRNASQLDLVGGGAGAAEVGVLLDAWSGRHLRELQVEVDLAGLDTLVCHPAAAGLRDLDVSDSDFSGRSARVLSDGPSLTGLISLNLG